ncbi:MAG: nucleotide exchange factor GrpE [Methanomassiliicoccaceae archaeon]|jgi:molecular chaperone GrpE|nr:nucleotide exchange factor GrpE [Methanomassiliicoccaceae archaeon]
MTGKSAREDAEKIRQDADERIAEAEKRASDNLDIARRIQADFDNYKKRTQRENEEFRKHASDSLIADILGIIDDLERALSHAPKDDDLAAGVGSIRNNLMKILSLKGLAEISTDGKFDPAVHEALCAEAGENDGEITEVFQKGYRIGDRVLRYAKVKVTKRQTEGEQKCQES